MYDTSKRYDFEIKEMEVDKDHIHMMIESVPKISPLQIVRVLKQQSTIQMWKIFQGTKEILLGILYYIMCDTYVLFLYLKKGV